MLTCASFILYKKTKTIFIQNLLVHAEYKIQGSRADRFRIRSRKSDMLYVISINGNCVGGGLVVSADDNWHFG